MKREISRILLLGDDDCAHEMTAGFEFFRNLQTGLVCNGVRFREFVVDTRSLPLNGAFLIRNPFSLAKRIQSRSVVIYYGMNPVSVFLIWSTCLVRNSRFVPIVVEWPVYRSGELSRRVWAFLYRFLVKFASKERIVISSELEKLIAVRCRKARTLTISVFGDLTIGPALQVEDQKVGPVVYCGSVDGYLDDVLLGVSAWGAAQCTNDLVIIGKSSPQSRETLREAGRKIGASNIQFYSNLSDHELKRFFDSAAVLIIPLRDNARNRARVPSKLIGYLKSGRPIVLSPVGDLRQKLQNVSGIYVAEGTDSMSIGLSIQTAILNGPLDSAAAQSRNDMLEGEFGLRTTGARLLEFLEVG